MIGPRPRLSAAVLATVLLAVGCLDQTSTTAPDDTGFEEGAIAFKPSCPGHPSCGDPPAPAGNATAELTGDVTTSSPQKVVISKDSRNALAGSGAETDEFEIATTLDLQGAAGGDPNDCVTDPPDLADRSGLWAALMDNEQYRTFRFTVNRKDPSNMTGNIWQSWSDASGQFRSRVSGASVTLTILVDGELWRYTGGSIVSWDMNTGDKLICESSGFVEMTLRP